MLSIIRVLVSYLEYISVPNFYLKSFKYRKLFHNLALEEFVYSVSKGSGYFLAIRNV